MIRLATRKAVKEKREDVNWKKQNMQAFLTKKVRINISKFVDDNLHNASYMCHKFKWENITQQ